MTIGTQQQTFVKLWFQSFERPRVTTLRNSEILLCRVCMVKLKRLDTTVVPAILTTSTFVLNSQLFQSDSSTLYSFSLTLATPVVLSRLRVTPEQSFTVCLTHLGDSVHTSSLAEGEGIEPSLRLPTGYDLASRRFTTQPTFLGRPLPLLRDLKVPVNE